MQDIPHSTAVFPVSADAHLLLNTDIMKRTNGRSVDLSTRRNALSEKAERGIEKYFDFIF